MKSKAKLLALPVVAALIVATMAPAANAQYTYYTSSYPSVVSYGTSWPSVYGNDDLMVGYGGYNGYGGYGGYGGYSGYNGYGYGGYGYGGYPYHRPGLVGSILNGLLGGWY